MKPALYRVALTSLALAAVTLTHAQELNVLQKSMVDELDRNMKELRLEGHEAPFFINYTISDQVSTKMYATLGALIASSDEPQRVKESIRVLVGDYDFNDESLDNNLFSPAGANEIELPLDDDYLGIRRSLWISTDNVYRSAAKQFKRNTELFKEQNKPLAEVPHRSFAKTPVSKVDIVGAQPGFDKTQLENYIRELSAIFKSYPEVRNSGVALAYNRGHNYQVNSEGSVNRTPFGIVVLSVSALLKTSDGDMPFTEMKHLYSSPAAMPPLDNMKKEVTGMIESLVKSASAKSFDDEYSGPVLYEGPAVAELMMSGLFGGDESLQATNAIQSLKGYRFNESNDIDKKIGKLVYAKNMTVKAMPKLRKYNDVELLGSFQVDDEGVVPPDELVLVENGVLKNLINDRTLVKAGQEANGMASGPGVVSVTFSNGVSLPDLRSQLIAQAKEQGLEYGIIVREAFRGYDMVNVYKVSVATGEEELVRDASVYRLTSKDFKRISDVSTAMQVQNILYQGSGAVSVITPMAVLLEEVEIGPSRMPSLAEEEYVSSPLQKP